MKNNPVVVNIGVIGGLLSTGTGILLDALNVSPGKATTLTGFIVGVLMLILSMITRQQVTPYDPAVNNTIDASFVTKAALDAATDPVSLVQATVHQLTSSAKATTTAAAKTRKR